MRRSASSPWPFLPAAGEAAGIDDHAALFALPDLPALVLGLLVGEPGRRPEAVILGGAPQHQDVDAAIGLAGATPRQHDPGGGIARAPWLGPWPDTLFQARHNAVGDGLIDICFHCLSRPKGCACNLARPSANERGEGGQGRPAGRGITRLGRGAKRTEGRGKPRRTRALARLALTAGGAAGPKGRAARPDLTKPAGTAVLLLSASAIVTAWAETPLRGSGPPGLERDPSRGRPDTARLRARRRSARLDGDAAHVVAVSGLNGWPCKATCSTILSKASRPLRRKDDRVPASTGRPRRAGMW